MPVYFVQEKDNPAGNVKIGYTDSLDVNKGRLPGLQTGSPVLLVVITVVQGSRKFEDLLHKHFVDLRVRGEWFRCEGELRDLLKDDAHLQLFAEQLKQVHDVDTKKSHGASEEPRRTRAELLSAAFRSVVLRRYDKKGLWTKAPWKRRGQNGIH